MLLDQSTILSDAQAITVTARSTNVLDMLAAGKQYNGNQLVRVNGIACIPFLLQVVENFAGLTSLSIAIQTSSTSDFSSDVLTHATFTVLLADLKAGYKIPYPVLPAQMKKRYLSVNYTVTGGPATAGKITAGVVAAVDYAYRGNV